MVAPWSALQNYSHKVKLVPGSGKKGKVAQLCINVLLKDCTAAPLKRSLVQAIPSPDITIALVPDAKVVGPGIQKIQSAQKKSKKELKKQQQKALNAAAAAKEAAA
eukprot:GHVU01023731.1.p2 GENE.GHVU01023731.1~~GHVU01023731.1.p2  ORF type:complete len:106 (+),score=31.86 GHVU01023731.1:147-464(+)